MNAFAPFSQETAWPVIGHERAIQMLRRSIVNGRLSHAYLFTGPQGTGKRTLAIAFAMALNCQSGDPSSDQPPDVPCGLCSACQRILHGAHPDVVEVSLETQAQALAQTAGKGKVATPKELRIDTIREMQATVGLRPHSGRWKVYIVGDADRLNEEAANCMLKTLEEPPQHTILVLLASDEAAVLPTISSRCIQVPLRALGKATVKESLLKKWGLDDPDRADLLAALSGGRLGYAVNLLQDSSALEDRRSYLQELALLGKATVSDRMEAAARFAKQFTDARPALYAMLDTWESWWRDVLIVSAQASELAANVDQMQALSASASRNSPKRAAEALELISQTRQQLQENVNPRLALESLALGMP
jgi:DNA polymerase-3 subunit delta'